MKRWDLELTFNSSGYTPSVTLFRARERSVMRGADALYEA